jgi:hypothetical protein
MIFEKNSFVPRADRHIQALSVDKAAAVPVFSTTISVNGKDYGTARVVVDTGAEHGAMLYARFAARHSINELGGWKTGKNCGIGGLGSFLYGLHGSAVVGQEQVALPDIAVMLNKNGIAQSDLYDAFLGGAVLARWSIVFDIPNGKIYLLDRSDATPPAGSNVSPWLHP